MKTIIMRCMVVVGWLSLLLTAFWAFCYNLYDPKIYGHFLIFGLPWKVTLGLSVLVMADEPWLGRWLGDVRSLIKELSSKMDPEHGELIEENAGTPWYRRLMRFRR